MRLLRRARAPVPRDGVDGRGFTLVEVVLGLALLALVIGLVQGVYSGVSRSRERVSERTAGAHAAALLLHRLADELGSARVVDTGSEAAPGFSLDRDAAGDAELEFSTVLPRSLQEGDDARRGAAPPEGFVRLVYALTDADGVRSLGRTDSRSGEEGAEPAPGEVLQHVTRFRVQVSADGEEWRDTWKAGEAGDEDATPRVVAIEVAWREGAEGEGPERSLRTWAQLYGVPPP